MEQRAWLGMCVCKLGLSRNLFNIATGGSGLRRFQQTEASGVKGLSTGEDPLKRDPGNAVELCQKKFPQTS